MSNQLMNTREISIGELLHYYTKDGDHPEIDAGKEYPAMLVNIRTEGPLDFPVHDIMVFTEKGILIKNDVSISFFGNKKQGGATFTPGTFTRYNFVETLGLSNKLIEL
ncbi:hypothetical protein IC620_10110 [Hazenella sp. IB182357]|uniref:Uncharacterized protein n=1 Tax=Polycladospora coralii TaxID=2771432 RepID=A0A926N6C0_9BACL|nr:hypothetical protein [Polycladospora coralii]MBD1372709.1 hypothetical protein [Polycladospora coralii]